MEDWLGGCCTDEGGVGKGRKPLRVWVGGASMLYKYLGFLIDDCLSFGPHIQYLVKKLKSKLGLFLESSIVFLLQQGRDW